MNEAIGQVLSFAVGVAISPLPIVAVVLMLATPRGRINGPTFVAGWIIGLTVLGGIVLAASSGAGASEDGEPATWVSVLELVLGLLLVLFAVRQWRRRPRGDEPTELPKLLQTIDTFTPGKTFVIAVALAAVNPKNLLLTVGAATAIAQTGIDTVEQVIALEVFVVIATLGVAAPVVIYYALGDRSAKLLGELRTWLAAHNAAIMAVLLLVIGAKLLGDGISGL
jgi:threonine/homoserine/homoserine lactone efflux protein